MGRVLISGCQCDACANRPLVEPDGKIRVEPMEPAVLAGHWSDIEMLRASIGAPWWRRAWAALCRLGDRLALAAFGRVRL